MPSTKSRGRRASLWCAWIAAAGFVAAEILTNRMRVDIPTQRLVERPPGIVAVVALAAATVSALVCWAAYSRSVDRWVYITAVLVTGILATGFQAIAVSVGWFRGTAFETPLLVQAFVYGLSLTGSVALILSAFRYLAARSVRLAVTAYAVFLLAVVILTVLADRALLADGVYRFGREYTITTDVGYGLVLYILPLLLYQGLARTQRSTTA